MRKNILLCRLFPLFMGMCLVSGVQAFQVSKTGSKELKWPVPLVAYQVNVSAGPAGAAAAFRAAMITWSTVPGSAFQFTYSETTQSGDSGDGKNVCSFGNLGSCDTLAYNSYWYNSNGQMTESDIVVNSYYSWSTKGEANRFDLQSTVTHEMGHALSLEDLYGDGDADKTMYGYTGIGETGSRTLSADDMAGIAYLYPGSSVQVDPVAPLPVVPSPVVPDPNDAALTTVGDFDGYFYNGDDASVRGTLALTVGTLAGRLTAKAVRQRGALSFGAATWASKQADGTCVAVLTAAGGETLNVSVRQNRIWGTLSGGAVGETLSLEGARNRFKVIADKTAQTQLRGFLGYYTVALPVAQGRSLGTADAAPRGTGYLTVKVSSGGSVKIAGVLADGTAVTQASRLILYTGRGSEACVPFFVPLYLKQGWAGGLLWLDPVARTVVTEREQGWLLHWDKPGAGPDGFSMLLEADGGLYGAAAGAQQDYRFSADAGGVAYHNAAGGETSVLAEALPDGIEVTANGTRLVMSKGVRPVLDGGTYRYTGENSALTTLSFSSATGIFKGKFNLYYDDAQQGRLTHKVVSVPYACVLTRVRGTAFAGAPAGQGYCLVPDNDPAVTAYRLKRSLPVRLEAAP